MAKEVFKSCFNEKETAKSILRLDICRRKHMRRDYKEKRYPEYFIIMIKYLISLGKSPEEIKNILRKHTTLFIYYCDVYYYMGNKKESEKYENYKLKEFDELLCKDEIELVKIINVDFKRYYSNPYYCLYTAEDFKAIKKSRELILKNEKNDLARANEGYLLKSFFDYFYYNCRFKSNPIENYGHIDLAIAFCLNTPDLKEFYFKALDDNYDIYWIVKSDKTHNIIKEEMLGYVIDLIFESDNFDFSKLMKPRNEYYYNIMLGFPRVKTIGSSFKFLHIDDNGIATIDTDSISNDFSFLYNEGKYIFSKSGIKRID